MDQDLKTKACRVDLEVEDPLMAETTPPLSGPVYTTVYSAMGIPTAPA